MTQGRILVAERKDKRIGSNLETSQKDLIKGLLSLGHEPAKVMYDGRTIFYIFTSEEVREHYNQILTNSDLLVPLAKVQYADNLWAMLLTRANELWRESSGV